MTAIERSTTELRMVKLPPDVSRTRDHSNTASYLLDIHAPQCSIYTVYTYYFLNLTKFTYVRISQLFKHLYNLTISLTPF